MSATLPVKAELTKIARLLEKAPEELSDLAGLGHDRLVQLRSALNDALFEATADKLERMASASKLAPIPLAASIAQQVLHPSLAAGVAGLLEEDRAVKFARKLPAEFMADVAVAMDPRRAAPILKTIPTKQAVEVGRVLVERADYVTMGRFVTVMRDDALLAALDDMPDAALLQIACVIEDRSNLDHLIDLVPDFRIANVIHAAADHDLWADALDLIGGVSDDRRAKLADLAAQQDEAMLNSLVRAVSAENLFGELLGVLEAMSPSSLRRIAKIPALHEPDVLAAITQATIDTGSWPTTLPIVPFLPAAARKTLAGLPAFSDPTVIAQVVDAARSSDRWAHVLPMVPVLSETVRKQVAGLLADGDVAVVDRLVEAAVATDQWDALLPLIPSLPKPLADRVSKKASTLDKDALAAAMSSASESGHLDTMMDVAASMDDDAKENVVQVIVDGAEDDDLLGSTLDTDARDALWGKVMGLAEGSPAPLLEELGKRAAAVHLDDVVPMIMSASDVSGMWQTGLNILSGTDDQLGEGVVASAMAVPSDVMQRAAEQIESMGIKDRLGPLAGVVDAQLAGKLTDDVRKRALSAASTASDMASAFTAGLTGDAYTSPAALAADVAAKLPGIGSLLGQRTRKQS